MKNENINKIINKIKEKLKKPLYKLLALIMILLIFLLITFFTFALIMNSPVKMDKENYIFHVKKGMTIKALSVKLKEHKLIKSKFYFYLISRLNKLSRKLFPGYYKIKKNMSTGDIVTLFASGQFIRIKITIPEGLTNLQIAERLENKGLCKAEDFLKAANNPKLARKFGISGNSFEGFLFPATYNFPYGASPERIVKLMYKNFKNMISKLKQNKSGLNFYKTIILASLIEGETFVNEEKRRIAGVYINRLRKNKLLQADITVKYIKMPKIMELRKQIKKLRIKLENETNQSVKKSIEREIKILKRRATIITYRDLKIDHPYNTYVNTGLPPGPVCNPGLISIKAAFNPENTNYLFYFWDPKKQEHIFSRNYQTHKTKLILMRRRQRRESNQN